MPYTPPSHRSPASSASTSPDVSRRSSIQNGTRPSLPRSASYLKKHRRTPSVTVTSDGSASPLTPQATEEDLPSMANASAFSATASVRKSPPPITCNTGIPNGAIISPPESASSGSDDERIPEVRGRRADRLKDLREAVSQIPQVRTPSPAGREPPPEQEKAGSRSPGMRASFSTTALSDMPKTGRKISHTRSMTVPNTSAINSSTDNSEEDTDEDLTQKPVMVRKKSGELVRPALRPSHRRPSSMPGTPVFSKAVHFDSHLEHVRHFLQVDRPLAVSAGSSPAEAYESDTEYPFDKEDRSGTRSPPYEWEIQTANFPHDSHHRKLQPVRMERVWLSADQKSLMGSIAVANLAFQKSVVCRFTLDYWKTTSEVTAEYIHEIRPKETHTGNDRFNFNIKLSDTANLESKTLFFCVRYNVDGQEFWDNNNSSNFQVDFKKKHLPQNGKRNYQGASSRPANGLPRSNRRQSPAAVPRPKSMPAGFSDFGDDSKMVFGQPIHEYLGESETVGLRLKTKSTKNLASDNITKELSSPSGVAFATRYDFGASLSAAVQAAKDMIPKDKDALYMKDHVRGGSAPAVPLKAPVVESPLASSPLSTGANSPNTLLANSSYEELVQKYCFFGTKPSDAPSTNKAETRETTSRTASTVSSAVVSPLVPAGPAAHHHINLHDPMNHYFSGSTLGATQLASSPLWQASSAASSQASTPKVVTGLRSTSTSPGFSVGVPDDVAFHASSQVLPERFPWGGDIQPTQAIQG